MKVIVPLTKDQRKKFKKVICPSPREEKLLMRWVNGVMPRTACRICCHPASMQIHTANWTQRNYNGEWISRSTDEGSIDGSMCPALAVPTKQNEQKTLADSICQYDVEEICILPDPEWKMIISYDMYWINPMTINFLFSDFWNFFFFFFFFFLFFLLNILCPPITSRCTVSSNRHGHLDHWYPSCLPGRERHRPQSPRGTMTSPCCSV